MVPILGTVAAQLNGETETEQDNKQETKTIKLATNIQGDHHPALLSLLAGELSVKTEEIHDFEMWVKMQGLLLVLTSSTGTFMTLSLLASVE